jgi:hypothetical protein
MKNLLFALGLLTISAVTNTAKADFMLALNSGYYSNSDGSTKFTFSDMTNHLFIGASLGSKAQLYLGQNVSKKVTQYKTTGTDKISTLELGPRINYYFNVDKTLLMILAWNPYAKGERTTAAGATQDISGYSFLVGLGYEIKMSRSLYLGTSIVYNALNISKYEVSNTSTEVSESYSSITPMINLSFRFR